MVGRSVVFLLLPLILIVTIATPQAFAQSAPQSPSDASQTLIDRAESLYRQGADAHRKGLPDDARKFFDQAVDALLLSGIDLRSDAKLDAYYRDLLNRIHKYEAQPDDDHGEDVRPEIVETAVLDELSEIKDSELATATQNGVQIYGRYDFDFSVAQPVFQFMSFFVSGRGRSTMETGLKRSGRYRQMAEKIFQEERVPLDLIWLAQAESVWKPNALSRAAAKGIWQFIPSTGARYGLSQTQWIDQRSHPEMSTRAAARYLRFLHDYFAGDWLLAMAAYNSGENRVAGAIAKCGYADFWEIHRRGLLPQETRNYVPIILSIIIISKNQGRYGFSVTPEPPMNYDIFQLPAQTDLKVVADLMGIPYESVQDLNPELRRGASPPSQSYNIKVPKGMKGQLEVAYAALPEDQRVRRVVIPREEVAEVMRPRYSVQTASYQVRRGDTLAALARRHGVSVSELARLNRMSARGSLKKGQAIRIPASARASRGRATHARVRAGRYSAKHVVRSRVTSKSKAKARGSSSRGKSTRRRR
ncbi:MAG TPA: transglycosylase SLT domain-containing protein [Blastocatellia bacterium]|nr:transglycosylase SLT domain-containing protein [Blastocatellia bacterium]